VNHCQREGLFRPITSSPVADGFGIVIHGFHGGIIDSEIEVSEDSLFMPSEHSSKVSKGFYPAVGCPPEPALPYLAGICA